MSLDDRGNLLIHKFFHSAGVAASSGVVWSPTSGKRWVLTDLIVSTTPASNIRLEENLSEGAASLIAVDLAANGGFAKRFKSPIVCSEANADLIVTSTAGNITVTATGFEL